MVDPFLIYSGVIAAGVGVAAYGLRMRDLVRRGRLHRRAEQLALRGGASTLPEGRVPCPECMEAILPGARRCPFCRSVVQGRV
ncbi:MAG: hypothetical protein ACHQQ3_09720 [Gemmatimonadales bacterium]